MRLLLAASSSYTIGELTGTVLAGVLAVWLALRAVGVLPRRAAGNIAAVSTGRSALASVSPTGNQLATSVAPPGLTQSSPSGVTPAPAPVRAAPGRARGFRWGPALGALVFGAACIASAAHFSSVGVGSSGATRSFLATRTGQEVRAGFLNGCEQTRSTPRCECEFAHISSQPGYNSLAGWASLQAGVIASTRTGNPSVLPRVIISAVLACKQYA